MLERVIRFLRSSRSAVLLMGLYALLMAVATVVEKFYSTPVAKTLIYYSPLFLLLHVAMVANFVALTLHRRLWTVRRWPYVLVHGAFVIILIGATVTHFFSREGIVSLREGERTDRMLVRDGGAMHEEMLPFEVELLDFELVRYPGSQSPSSFESTLKISHGDKTFEQKVYMNHVLDFEGYRFFQASYDSDEGGSILSVSYDVTGRRITYTGYLILFFGLAGCFVSKNARFRRLSRQLKAVAVGVLLLSATGVEAQTVDPYRVIDRDHAERFGNLPMQSMDGRIIPVNTFSSELARKLQLEKSVSDLDSDQFLLGVLSAPNLWAHQPIIRVEDKALSTTFTDGREAISYRDAFDAAGHYRWGAAVEEAYQKNPALRSALDRELLKLDERVNLLHQLFNMQLIRLFPRSDDIEGHHWMAPGDNLGVMTREDSTKTVTLFRTYRNALIASDWTAADHVLEQIRTYQQEHRAGLEIATDRIEAEARYNRVNFLRHAKQVYLIFGGLLLVLTFVKWFRRREPSPLCISRRILSVGVVVVFLLHAANMGIRWYISGYAPWSNSYETMVFLAWVSVGAGLCFVRRSFMTFALSILFGGVVLFVSGLSWMDPQITPLVPVLKSPWLMFHVATLMISYGFLGLACMISTLNLLASAFVSPRNRSEIGERINRLTMVNELALMIGLALMMVGIFLGAVWANESWGRYWSWDPKETWALITAVIYAAVLHLRWFEQKRNNLRFNLLAQLSFLSVLMTYFGVNYLLSGMHAYGNTSGLAALPWWAFVVFGLFFVVPGIAACVRKK